MDKDILLQQRGLEDKDCMTNRRGSAKTIPPSSLANNSDASLPAHDGDDPGIPCRICQDAGYYLLDVPPTDINFGVLIACDCKLQELMERRISQLRQESNLLTREDLTFDSFNPTIPGVSKAYRLALGYARQPRGWLVIGGKYGCGKSHLAAAVGWEVLKKGYGVLFLTFPDLMDELEKAERQVDDRFIYPYLTSLRTMPLLILDSFEAPSTGNVDHRLFQLLDARYNTRMPTIFTMDLEALSQLHPRIHSRMIDDVVCERVLIEAGDYRQMPLAERLRPRKHQ